MRSLLVRFAVLGTLAVSLGACSSGNGSTLPFAGTPNAAGANSGTFQAGASGQALVRFVHGSPDAGPVDICVDQSVLTPGPTTLNYGGASALIAISSGIPHTVSIYPASKTAPGAECATAPQPYLGTAAVKTATVTPAANSRTDFVVGGTLGGKTLAVFAFPQPTFPTAPGSPEVISHNAAPSYTTGKTGVGFGTCTAAAVAPAICGTPAALAGATNVAIGKSVTSPLAAPPVAGFYDGAGVASGTPVPVAVATVAGAAGQPYVINLYAVDAIGVTPLGLIAVQEQTVGFGF